MISFARQSVDIVEPSWVDDRGTMRPNYASPISSKTIPNCSVQPGASSEDLQNRTQVTIRYNVYLPAGTAISDMAQVVYKGRPFSINGDVADWESPTGRVSHLVANLVDWEG